jgi:hypothetical protein
VRRQAATGLYGDVVKNNIESMLIILPPSSPPLSNEAELSLEMDLTVLPKLLHDRFGMIIVNHDGGHSGNNFNLSTIFLNKLFMFFNTVPLIVLRDFCKAGVIPQMNLTLCRQLSVKQVVSTISGIDDTVRRNCLGETFEARMKYFFNSKDIHTLKNIRSLPCNLKVAAVVSDSADDVAVVTVYTKGGFDIFID